MSRWLMFAVVLVCVVGCECVVRHEHVVKLDEDEDTDNRTPDQKLCDDAEAVILDWEFQSFDEKSRGEFGVQYKLALSGVHSKFKDLAEKSPKAAHTWFNKHFSKDDTPEQIVKKANELNLKIQDE